MDSDNKIRLLCIGRDLAGGGAERVQLALLKHLDRNKFNIRLFYLQDRGDLHHLIPSDLNPTFGVPAGSSIKIHAPSILIKLIAMAKESDLIFAMMQGTPTYLPAIIGRIANLPVVGWMHSVWSKDLDHELSRWHRPVSHLLYPLIDHFLAVSNGVAEDLMAFSPALTDRVTKIPNFIPLNTIQELSQETLPNWAVKIFEKRVVLGVGQLIPRKGFDLLIGAVATLVEAGHDLNLLILGQGPEHSQLEILASNFGLSERVFLQGFQKNPYPFFKQSKLFVLSSSYEGFGMVLIEALALGACVVATDCQSGPREILKEGQYGILVPPDNVDALVDGMSSLLSNPVVMERLQAQGLEYVQEFDTRKGVNVIEDLLARILAEESSR